MELIKGKRYWINERFGIYEMTDMNGFNYFKMEDDSIVSYPNYIEPMTELEFVKNVFKNKFKPCCKGGKEWYEVDIRFNEFKYIKDLIERI